MELTMYPFIESDNVRLDAGLSCGYRGWGRGLKTAPEPYAAEDIFRFDFSVNFFL